MGRALIITAALAAASATFHARPATACHNGVVYDLDSDVQEITRAERLLARGQPARAMRVAHRIVRRMRRGARASARAAIKRGQRVMAVAVVRLDGSVDLRRRRAVEFVTDGQRLRNLRWARELLGGLRAGADDPLLDARYAEALAALPDGRDRARTLLRSLADEDLLPDAFAWRTLADLERLAGRTAEAASALTRCNQRAGARRRAVCGTPASGTPAS